jgi:hypothetical protein
MKKIILAFFLSAGIAGAYAQTNNGTGTTPGQHSDPTVNPGSSSPVNPNDKGANNGVDKTGQYNSGSKGPNSGSQIAPDTTQSPNRTSPNGSSTTPGNSSTPNNKKSTAPGNSTPATPNNKPMVK